MTLRQTPDGAVLTDPRPPARSASSRPSATIARRRQPAHVVRPTHWRGLALSLAAMLAAYASMHVVLRDVSWWFAGAAFATGVLLAISVTRYVVRSWWIPPLVGAGAALVGVTAAFASDAAFLGLLPTFDALGRLNEVANAGWISIQEQRVPANPDPGIVLLLVLTMIACALFADAAVAIVKAPALVAVPLLLLVGIPVSVRADIADPVWFALTAVLYLAILRVGRRPTSRAVLAATGALAIVGGFLTPVFLPQVEEQSGSLVGGVTTGINPLINLGDDLRRGDPVLAVSYQTTAEEPVYLRLATLESFNSRSWTPNVVDDDPRNTVDDFPAPPGVGPDVGRIDETMSVQIGDIAGRWLPLPYPAESVEGLSGTWLWERSGLTARAQDVGVGGQQYSIEFVDLEPTLEQVQVSRPVTDPDELDDLTLALPDRVPQNIRDVALEVAGDKTTSYEIALALQDYFTGGEFDYSEDAPVERGYDGSGVDIIGRFLQEKSGYCVHFSSAMALMARILGIPSRVAVGFVPGQQVSTEGVPSYLVTSHDLHAWPELYFEDVGWLRFEPTPGRGELPQYDEEPAVDDPSTPEDEGATPRPTSSADPGAVPERPDTEGVDPGLAAGGSTGAGPLPFVLGGLLALLLLVALAPALIRVVVRRRRERRIRSGPDPASAAWDEVRDTARDHGWAAPDSETPRDFADRLALVLDDGTALRGFRSDVEESAFAPPGRGVPTVEELRGLRRAIARTVPARERVRATLLPASLMTRFRWDPEG